MIKDTKTVDEFLHSLIILDENKRLLTILSSSIYEVQAKFTIIDRLFDSPLVSDTLKRLATKSWSCPSKFVNELAYIVQEHLLDEIDSKNVLIDLQIINNAVIRVRGLGDVLSNKRETASMRVALVMELFVGLRVEALMLTELATITLEKYRFRATLRGIIDRLCERNNLCRIKVISANKLSENQLNEIAKYVGKNYPGEPWVDTRVDPALIGGMRIQVAGKTIDATIAKQFKTLELGVR